MLKSLPVQLILCVILAVLVGDFLNAQTISTFYTLSVLLKDILMFFLPLIIFSYLLAAMLSFKRQALLMILILDILIIFSNAATVLTAYGAALFTFPFLGCAQFQEINAVSNDIVALWRFPLTNPLLPEWAMLSAVGVGVLGSFMEWQPLKNMADVLRTVSTAFLKHAFIPFLPIYVFGFVLKMNHDGALSILVQHYGQVFALSCVLIVVYISFLYWVAANFNLQRFLETIKEMLPAGLTGFSTMSSAASMPVTLTATAKNLKGSSYGDFAIPTTVNAHLVADGLNISLTSLALLVMSGQAIPDLTHYLEFTLFYCLAKFSCAGVPGGGVLVILPVAQTYLGLSPESATLLATIYILQDPIMTAGNVMGNGAFALLTEKVFRKLRFLKDDTSAGNLNCVNKTA